MPSGEEERRDDRRQVPETTRGNEETWGNAKNARTAARINNSDDQQKASRKD